MTTYRITVRNRKTGVVVYVGAVDAGGEKLALYRAGEKWPDYGDEVKFTFKAEPMILRFPALVQRGVKS